ncbi:MAG: class I SAM-dependent methyltransferase [Planctomycetes bacterium]|nr:class I SAM-dependent methyltransferase [Planctomycetota bacterium]
MSKRTPMSRPRVDKYSLYEAAVQCVDADLDFCERVYARANGAPLRILREDFCATAAISCAFAARDASHLAIGVDLDARVLEQATRRNLSPLDAKTRSRVRLLHANVLEVTQPQVECVAALNFSYWVFKRRADLVAYFKTACRSLRPGGLLVLDAFGGTDASKASTDRRAIAATTVHDGTRVPRFTYVWRQAHFDAVSHDFLCHIDFELRDGRTFKRAFTYDWRLWTLAELRDALADAGFAESAVYTDGWDEDEKEGDGIYRKRVRVENDGVWIAYVVARKAP